MQVVRRIQLVVGLVLVALANPFAIAEAQRGQTEAPPVPMAESTSQLAGLKIRILSAKTGEPLEGVELSFIGRVGPRNLNRTLKTDAEGKTELTFSSSASIPNMRFTTKKAGYVPAHYMWRSDQSVVELPEELEVKLDPGAKVGGVVRDEAGKPVPGAKLDIYMPITFPLTDGYVFTIANPTTDREGRWELAEAPADGSRVSIGVSHPDYLAFNRRMTPGTDDVIVLKQGISLRGSVVDKDGKPVPFARVWFGNNRASDRSSQSVTDPEGLFELKNCQPGQSLVTVMSELHAPKVQQVVVVAKNEPLKFVLEPGYTVRGRVVDGDGKPLSGVNVSPSTWQGTRVLEQSLTTNAEGRFEWRTAPADSVGYRISRAGYMAIRDHMLAPSNDEQVITLHPELVVSGKVTDAETGEPMKSFRLQRGQSFENSTQLYWYEEETSTYTGGEYSHSFTQPAGGWLVRIMADGYLPADSRAFKTNEGKVTFDVGLKRGKGISGVVVLPDGKPAAGAELALVRSGGYTQISQGRFTRDRQSPVVAADNEGKFTLPPQSGEQPFLVIVLHDGGFAELNSEELKKSDQIKLAAWGKLEGRVMKGARPDANAQVNYQQNRARDYDESTHIQHPYFNYAATTDAEGRFQFDRLKPGRGYAARVVSIDRPNGGRTSTYSSNTPVDIRPGETVQATIGGRGRTVIGSLAVDREPETTTNWNNFVSITQRNAATDPSGFQISYSGVVDQDHRFEAVDVPAGEYTLSFDLAANDRDMWGGNSIGRASADFTIPEMPGGRSDEPFDLKTVTVKLYDTLDAGETAPDITLAGLDGKNFRFSEFGGKLVLVNFLGAGSRDNFGDQSMFKRMFDKFGKDPNFAMLSVWCGGDVEAVKRITAGSGYNWRHATVPGIWYRGPQRFMVRSLPTTFLIGGNRKVLGRNLKEEELAKAIDEMLGLGELFAATQGPPPARFPLSNFAVTEAAALAAAPALVVFDDTDQKYDASAASDDRLRLIAADGKELWSQGGFHHVPGANSMAIDRQRGRIYIAESTRERVTALNLTGQKLWQAEQIEAGNLAIDEKTGNLWVVGTSQANIGETMVLDPDGREVANHPFGGQAVAYDPHDGAFWLVGTEIIKLSGAGELLFRRNVPGGYCPSVTVNAADGSPRIVELMNGDRPESKNRLWVLNADGTPRQEIDLAKEGAMAVAYSAKENAAWIAVYNVGLKRVAADGKIADALARGTLNVAVSPSGEVWVNTDEAVIRLDSAGKELARSPFHTKSQRASMAAF